MNTKWADVDEDDDFDDVAQDQPRFESEADEKGIRTITEYVDREGKTVKVIRKVRTTKKVEKEHPKIRERRAWKKFGKEIDPDEKTARTEAEPTIFELSDKYRSRLQTSGTVDEESRFFEEQVDRSLGRSKKQTIWAKRAEAKENAADGDEDGAKLGVYMPPGAKGGKGDGKGLRDDENRTVRVSNLAEDVGDLDLEELFGSVGRVERVRIIRNKETNESRGFGFVTFKEPRMAEDAIARLNGHGYDNLILRVGHTQGYLDQMEEQKKNARAAGLTAPGGFPSLASAGKGRR
jgi:translation initiation factor 3 subunit G